MRDRLTEQELVYALGVRTGTRVGRGEHQPFAALIESIKARWRIERDYQELKREFGLGHYEGRN